MGNKKRTIQPRYCIILSDETIGWRDTFEEAKRAIKFIKGAKNDSGGENKHHEWNTGDRIEKYHKNRLLRIYFPPFY